jgi:hypothetical protein
MPSITRPGAGEAAGGTSVLHARAPDVLPRPPVKGLVKVSLSPITVSPGRRVVIASRIKGSANFGRHHPNHTMIVEETVSFSASEQGGA